jgi:hypothetical protein
MEKDRTDKLVEGDRIGEPPRDLIGYIVTFARLDFRDNLAELVER